MIAETFTQLLRDPAHWQFELLGLFVTDVLIGIVGVRLWQRWHRKHDREVHPKIDHRHPIPPHRHFSVGGQQQSGEVDYLDSPPYVCGHDLDGGH